MRQAYRQAELDWLRGLMLVLMTVTHLPTWYSAKLGQPFGFVSAAEGFVFISGFLVGSVYTRIARDAGFASVRWRLWRRTAQIYVAHVGVLLFLLWILLPVAVTRGAHPITDLASFYLQQPDQALIGGLMLVYNPPLLDILPMYVLFIAVSPLLLEFGTWRRGWLAIGVGSIALWLLAQFDVGHVLYDGLAKVIALPVPYRQTGAFSFMAWQAIWVAGLWAGTRSVDGNPWPRSRSAPVIAVAAMMALAFFCWRHWAGQVPNTYPMVVHALDKWHLGVLRLVDFASLVVLTLAVRSTFARWAERSVLATMGKVSLTIFCAHVVICLAALASVADPAPAHLHWRDSALLGFTMATLYLIALLSVEGRRALPALSARLAARMAR